MGKWKTAGIGGLKIHEKSGFSLCNWFGVNYLRVSDETGGSFAQMDPKIICDVKHLIFSMVPADLTIKKIELEICRFHLKPADVHRKVVGLQMLHFKIQDHEICRHHCPIGRSAGFSWNLRISLTRILTIEICRLPFLNGIWFGYYQLLLSERFGWKVSRFLTTHQQWNRYLIMSLHRLLLGWMMLSLQLLLTGLAKKLLGTNLMSSVFHRVSTFILDINMYLVS